MQDVVAAVVVVGQKEKVAKNFSNKFGEIKHINLKNKNRATN